MQKIILPTTVRAIKHFQIVNPVDHNQVKDYAQECEIDVRTLLVDIGLFSATANGLVPKSQGKSNVKFLCENGAWAEPTGSGTVLSVAVKDENGVSGHVDNSTTKAEIIISLGDITPKSVAAKGDITGKNLSGINTGDQTITLKGAITGNGTGDIETTIPDNSIGGSKLAQLSGECLIGNPDKDVGNAGVVGLGFGLAFNEGQLMITNEVCLNSDPRLADPRTPVGTPLTGIWIGNGTAKQVEITGDVTLDSDGVVAITNIPASALNADVFDVLCATDDERLLNARTPVGTELSSTCIWVGDGTNLATPVAVTGDVAISNTGKTELNMESKHVWQAQQVVGQVDLKGSKNVAWNLDTQQNAKLLLQGNWFLANPANMVAGATYNLVVEQDEVGNRVLSFGNMYNGIQVLSTEIRAIDILTFYCDGKALHCISHKKF